MKTTRTISTELKYKLYEDSVQCHESDIEFIQKEYKRFYKKNPYTLREDFGGTGAMACDWVKQGLDYKAWAIDLDEEPVKYGKENHYMRLNDEQKNRMTYIMGNVLEDYSFNSDITVAFNFSYFIFKKRKELLEYFKKVHKNLNNEGAFFLDIFGGTECLDPIEEETEYDKHTYYWDLDKYNPLNNECTYYIHFKTHEDKVKYERVFAYDWRMWSVREITELMEEAGFSAVHTYWEGEDEDGDGDGNFYLSNDEENCESWVIYIVGLK